MNLKNKVVLITGATSGLGLALAQQLAKEKCQLVLLGRDRKKLNQLKSKLGSFKVNLLVCDLKDQRQIKTAVKKLDRVDVLINCAGIIAYQALEKHDWQNIKDIISTNLLGTIFLTQAVLPKMKKQNSGTILNVSSTSGLMTGGHPYESVYIASKFGVTGFTEALKKEIREEKKNIKVIGFYPGGMKTKLYAKAGLKKDIAKFMDPDKVAKIVVFMLRQPDSLVMDNVVVNRNKNI